MAKRNRTRSVKISDLNRELEHVSWKIKASVSFEENGIRNLKSGERSFKMFSVFLQDRSGVIKGNAYDQFAERLSLKIRNNKKYVVSGAQILPAHSANKTSHQFELRFTGNTEFKDVDTGWVYHLDDDHENMDDTESETETETRTVNLEPKKLVTVRKFRDCDELKYFDIFGIITKTTDVETKLNRESSEQFFVKEVSILDETEGVNLSLTSELMEKFEDFDWSKGMVIAVQGCYWKKLPQANILTARIEKVFKETELTEPVMHKIEKLRTWYETDRKPKKILTSRAPKQETNKVSQAKRPSEEQEDYASPGPSTSTLEIENKPLVKRQRAKKSSTKEQMVSEMNSSTVHLKWKKKSTCKRVKALQERGKIGHMTARIQIFCGKEAHYGTGFRVGSSYLLTAFHVVEGVLEKMWKALHHDLSPSERKEIGLKEVIHGMSVTKQLLPDRGPWSVKGMFKHLDTSKRERLYGIAKQMFTDDVSLYFDYVDENAQMSSIKVAYDIPFVSRSLDHDFVILQLFSQDQLPQKMFLQKFFIPIQCKKIILMGHPNGGVANYDKCQIMEEKDFEEWKSSNLTHFKNQGFNDHSIIEEYKCLQFSRKKIFFHVSPEMEGGCSGGPILTHDLNPKVIGFYHGGLPGALYNNLRWKDIERMKENKADAFIEMGISTEVIAEVLSADECYSHLLHDIF